MWVLDSPFNHMEGRLKQIQMDQIELDEVHGVEIPLVGGGAGGYIKFPDCCQISLQRNCENLKLSDRKCTPGGETRKCPENILFSNYFQKPSWIIDFFLPTLNGGHCLAGAPANV